MKSSFFSKNKFKIAIAAVLLLLVLILLYSWTNYIKEEREIEVLRSALEGVVEKDGEEAIFALSGIATDNLNYGDADLYINGSGAWSYLEEEQRVIEAYDKAKDSVVQIINRSSFSDESQASGVILSSDGYIVTNSHVVENGESFTVSYYDGSITSASLIGRDRITDIAVLKAEKENLTPITFSSIKPSVGMRALSIGNPYGYTWSLSSGVVSGLDRTIVTNEGLVIPSLIQTDNFINPGNSGGPLLDSYGNMIGLVSSIYSTTGSAEGISFALDGEVVKRVSNEIIRNKKVSRAIIDCTVAELNAQIAAYLNIPFSNGLIVSSLESGSEAEKAGLIAGDTAAELDGKTVYLGGDIIVSLNGVEIKSYSDYFKILFDLRDDEIVPITLYRDGKRINTRITLTELNEDNITRYVI